MKLRLIRISHISPFAVTLVVDSYYGFQNIYLICDSNYQTGTSAFLFKYSLQNLLNEL
jgi:hypothetical protein